MVKPLLHVDPSADSLRAQHTHTHNPFRKMLYLPTTENCRMAFKIRISISTVFHFENIKFQGMGVLDHSQPGVVELSWNPPLVQL